MSTPSIKVGQGNWGIKAGNLLGYANTDKKFVARDFTVGRLLSTATRVNASGNIEGVNANVPRIDYFGGQASLLVEPSATNLALQSENFLTTWSPTNISVSTGTTAAFTAPDGSTDADLLTESTDVSATNHQISQSISTSVVSGTTYTFSCFFKATPANRSVRLAISSALFVGAPTCFFDVTNGTVGTATDCTGRIDNYGSGWYRCAMTATCDVSGTASVFISSASGNTRDYIGNGSASLYAWGAQLETGSVATSYIPTTTVSVTRNADVVSVTGVAGLIGQTAGTIYCEFVQNNSTSINRIIAIDNGTNSDNGFDIITTAAGAIRVTYRVLGVAQCDITTPVATAVGVTYKVAFAYAQNDFVIYVNGIQEGTDSSGNTTLTPSRIILGGRSDGTGSARIRAAAIYTTRLPNTTTDGSPSLQSITTL